MLPRNCDARPDSPGPSPAPSLDQCWEPVALAVIPFLAELRPTRRRLELEQAAALADPARR
jgi:hypothetical protein